MANVVNAPGRAHPPRPRRAARGSFRPLAQASALGCLERFADRCVSLREMVLTLAASTTDHTVIETLPAQLVGAAAVVLAVGERRCGVAFGPGPEARPAGELWPDLWPDLAISDVAVVRRRARRWLGRDGGELLTHAEGRLFLAVSPLAKASFEEARQMGRAARAEALRTVEVRGLEAQVRTLAPLSTPGPRRLALIEAQEQLRRATQVAELAARRRLGGLWINQRLLGI